MMSSLICNNENTILSDKLNLLKTEFDKISYENSRFVEKYQNVDIDSIYSKCRTLESKLDYFKRVAEREKTKSKKCRGKLDKIKFSIAAGEYIKIMDAKGPRHKRLLRKLKQIQDTHESDEAVSNGGLSVSSSIKSVDIDDGPGVRRDFEEALNVQRKLKLIFMNFY